MDRRGSNHDVCGHKKRCTHGGGNTIIGDAMSLRLVEGGLARVAGQSCLAGPSVLRLHPSFEHRPGWVYGREPRPESQAFLCGVTHFLSTTGREFRGDLSPTRIVPGAIASRIPTHCNIYLQSWVLTPRCRSIKTALHLRRRCDGSHPAVSQAALRSHTLEGCPFLPS